MLCTGLSLSGHSSVEVGSTWRSELADWVHLSAACIWVGGLVQLAVVVWPAAPHLRREAFLRFSKLAAVLVGAMVLAGAYLAYLRLPQASDLWNEHYGRVLLLKSALVVVALSWGALHHFVVRPALERGRGTGSRAVSRSLLGESAVAIAILLVVAVLVDSNPPSQARAEPDASNRSQPLINRFPLSVSWRVAERLYASAALATRAARRKAVCGARRPAPRAAGQGSESRGGRIRTGDFLLPKQAL